MQILGIDIGGTGIKAGVVNTPTGELVGERWRVRTPRPSTPSAVAAAVADLARGLGWQGAIGCTFPSPIVGGVVKTAANVDKGWVGVDGEALLSEATGRPVRLINDADAAGIAEMRFGAGRGRDGVVMVLTFGTGIGSAIFVDGCLMPNTELGHLPLRGRDAETWASERARKRKDLSWDEWAGRVNEYLQLVEYLLWPDLFIFGGGVSRKHHKFLHLLKTRTPVVPAQLLNDAGVVGAALAAVRLAGEPVEADAAAREGAAAEAPAAAGGL